MNQALQKILFIAIMAFSFNVTAYDYPNKKEIAFKSEFRLFMEGALHKGTDNTENIPLYYRQGDFFYNGAEVAVFGQYQGVNQDIILKDKIEAGGYYRGSFGAEFPVAENLVFSTSIGFLYDEIMGKLTDGSNGNGYAGFTTTQIDFIGFYNYKRHRLGLGGSFHYNPKFNYKEEGSNFLMHGVYRFSNSVGPLIQYDYLVSENTSLGIRYTKILYDFENVTIGDYVNGTGDHFVENCINGCEDFIDASSFSAHMTYRF